MFSLTLSTWLTSTLHLDHSSSEKNQASQPYRYNLWNWLIDSYTHQPEPKVWQSTDRQGQLCWHAYDPVTNRSFWCASEDEMRCWLEERYSYQAVKSSSES